MFYDIAVRTGLAESILRLLTGLLLGYPFAFGYKRIVNTSKTIRLVYLLTTGLTTAYLFCQEDLIYSLTSILGTWFTCFLFQKARVFALVLCFFGNFGFLLYSYYNEASDDYDLNWTTCQAVLCLRLIGFVWDFYDGSNKHYAPSDKGSLTWVGDLSLKDLPNLVELYAYCYFFSGFLVGPLFSFKHFSQFLNNEFIAEAKTKSLESSFWKQATLYGRQCFAYGVVYLAFSQALIILFPESVVLNSEYNSAPMYKKYWLIFWCGKRAFTKYFGIWKLNEGPCAIAGLSFNGFQKDKPQLDGLCNIGPITLEIATSLSECVSVFNVNTNQWCKLYIFKRLRFLNNKNLSSLGTLLFLALWHGFHIGYYITFLFEFLIISVESEFFRITAGTKSNFITLTLGWLYTHFMLYFPVIAFDCLSLAKIRIAYDGIYWIPYLFGVAGFFILPMVPALRKQDKEIKIK